MRHYKTETETFERQAYQRTTCDKCGKVIPEQIGTATRNFELEFTRGHEHPSSGAHQGWSVDLCDTCVEWLKQGLINNRVTLVPVEVEW